MSRVCLCITGQMRNLEWTVRQLGWATEGHDVVVVFSVWDRIGRKVDGALNLYQLARMFDRGAFTAIPTSWHGYNVLWRKLPALHDTLLDSDGSSDEDQLREVIGRYLPDAILDMEGAALLDLEFQEERQDKNSVRMTYKIWRANQIRRKLERSLSHPFDVVIRVRPDLNFVNLRIGEIVERVKAGEFLVNNWLGHWSGDNFCAGTPSEMDAYASIFGRTVLLPLQWEFIHTDLARHLLANGLNVVRYVGLEDPLDDEKITTADLAAALEQQLIGEDWSPAHAATLAAARAALRLEAADPEGALAELSGYARATDLDVADLEGVLYTSGSTLLETGAPEAATGCFMAARYWEREGDDPRRRMALEAVAAAIAPHVDPAALFEPGPLAAALAMDFEPAWVADMLMAGGSEPTLEARLTALFREAFTSQQGGIALAEGFARSGRADLALAAVDQLAASLDEGTHRHVSQHVVSTNLLASPIGGEVDATSTLDYAIKLASENIFFGYDLANMLKEAGRFPEARSLQQALVEMDPSHAGAARQLAEICLHLGDADAARDYAAKAVSLDDQAPHRMLLAFAEFRRGDQDSARTHWAQLPHPPAAPASYRTLPGFEEFLRLGEPRPEASLAVAPGP